MDKQRKQSDRNPNWELKISTRDKTVIQIKNAFDWFISRLDMSEKRISDLELISIASLKTEKQTEQRLKNRTKYLRNVGQL